jgi:hypothetical protein
VGIDVSQAHNDVCAMNETGEVIEGHQRFDNDRLGFSDLERWLVDVLDAGQYDTLQIGGRPLDCCGSTPSGTSRS